MMATIQEVLNDRKVTAAELGVDPGKTLPLQNHRQTRPETSPLLPKHGDGDLVLARVKRKVLTVPDTNRLLAPRRRVVGPSWLNGNVDHE